MAAVVDEFVDLLSGGLLDHCSQDQLLLLAEKYGLEVAGRKFRSLLRPM